MAFEVEIKARLAHPEATEAAAKAIGEFRGETIKEDVYFRRAGDTDRIPAMRYRLRREAGRAVVTFKQTVAAAAVEVNEEVEFTVDDPRAFFRFAHYTGAEPFVVKHKISRVYRVGRANVEINLVRHVGHFTEIEILCATKAEIPAARLEISQVLARLGLDAHDVEPRRYIDLIQTAHPVRYRYNPASQVDWPFEEIATS